MSESRQVAAQLDDVLFLAYYFPPVGGAGVQRSVKFARYLPELGFRPIVVTGTGSALGRWEPTDDTLCAELSEDVVVQRADDAPGATSAGSRLDRLLGRPSAFSVWWRNTILEIGRRAAQAHAPRLIYVSLSPYEGLEPALLLGDELGLPVIADLRDPWALDEVRIYPSAWHRRRERRLMQRLFARCARILMNTPEAASCAREAFPDLPPDHFDWVTNGFDGEDFAGLAPRSRDGVFRILHTGYLHTAMGFSHRGRGLVRRALGGELVKVDFLPRSHYYLLEALERLEREKPGRTQSIELVLAGITTEVDERVIAESSFAKQVQTPGYLDHGSTVRAMVEADLLFLPMHALGGGRRARIVPGKTYEYLASGRPILAAVPPGDARDFVIEAGAGRCVPPDDVAGLANAIDRFLDQAPASMRERGEFVERFERRELTRKLAGHFRAVLATECTTPARPSTCPASS